MTSAKAGAASPSKVRRPAAPVPAGKHSTSVPHCRRTRARASSVSGTAKAVLFAFAFFGSLTAALIVGGMFASRYPLAAGGVGFVLLFAVTAHILGGKR